MSVETLALDSYITETLALNSIISEQISLDSGIADMIDNIEISFVGYLRLPAMTSIGFDISFWLYVPEEPSGSSSHILSMDTYSEFGQDGIHLNLNDTGSGVVFDLFETGEDGYFESAVRSSYPFWAHIRLKSDLSDGKVKIWVTETDGSQEYGEFVKGLTCSYADFTNVTLGAQVMGFLGYDNPVAVLNEGSKIKSMMGTYEFQVAYSDDGKTTLCTPSDDLAVMATPAGDAYQDIPGRRPTYVGESVTNKSLLALNSSLL